ncbi:MAG: S9 family peptidase [Gemmatimonadaceae bacterium]
MTEVRMFDRRPDPIRSSSSRQPGAGSQCPLARSRLVVCRRRRRLRPGLRPLAWARLLAVAFAVASFFPQTAHVQRSGGGVAAAYTLDQIKSYPFPNELTAAATGSRIAWAFNERGVRNIWVAEGPDFAARRLTRYSEDDGQELTGLSLSPNGEWVVYVRGGDHGSNWDDEVPVNVLGTPQSERVQIWAVPFAGGEPRSLGEGAAPVISPRGDVVAFERDRTIWIVAIDGSHPARRLFSLRGENGGARWSPDGSRLAFVSNRADHSFIGVYADSVTPILWLAPTTNRDASPRWSPDGTRLAFVRRPGSGGPLLDILGRRHQPWAIWTADARTGGGRELWKSPETLRGSLPNTHGGTNLHWAAGGRIVFLSYMDGWPHLYSLGEAGGEPLLLTPGNYMAEYIKLSADGRWLVFAGNAGSGADDLHRRHVVKVPVDRAAPEVMTPGTGLEWTPAVTGDGRSLAFIGATAQRPPLPMVMPLGGGAAKTLAADRVPGDFPAAQLVVPQAVTYKASDGLTVYATLFERAGAASKKPAVVYVHGGPPRQMLVGWHYSDYYSNAYAMNQYLASLGYVVLSVNFRLGIGYGYEFHQPPNAGSQGASEYLDVKGAAEYLRTLPQVDGARIGIYGGSYGGYLTALALARNSDLFAAGVDIHGVHDFTADGGARFGGTAWRYEQNDREKAARVAWESSPVSSIATWKSPVLLIHADDDRNVRFSQTVDLVRRLAAAKVPYEEIVIVDDTHHWMRFANLMRVNAATAEFFERKLKNGKPKA